MSKDLLAGVPSYEYTEQHFREMTGNNTRPMLFDSHDDELTWEEHLDREAEREEQEWIEQNAPMAWESRLSTYIGKPINPHAGFYVLPGGATAFID